MQNEQEILTTILTKIVDYNYLQLLLGCSNHPFKIRLCQRKCLNFNKSFGVLLNNLGIM